MFLKNIKFCRYKGQKYEWSMEGKPVNGIDGQAVSFEDINLVVGKNATGKSKMVDVLRRVADLFSGEIKITDLEYSDAIFEVFFQHEQDEIYYFLEFKNYKILQELLEINQDNKLDRKEGKLFYQELGEKLSFQTSDDLLAITKGDSFQQPFFKILADWGKNLSHYRFGTPLGRDRVFGGNIDVDLVTKQNISLKTNDKILFTFLKALDIPNFESVIIDDMSKIGYNIQKISYGKQPVLTSAFGITVKEIDIETETPQLEMSQGMFRALSLLVQLNFSLMSKIPSCILIDDIGEGLDYERSKSLIDLIIEKVKGSSVQVIMTTNDRFVMNNVPLRYWSVIHRLPKKSVFYNYQNSKETFDDFSLTRLNNFEFFSTDFFEKGFEEYVKDVER